MSDELVNVRYMVDDVERADRVLHHPLRLQRAHSAAPAFADVVRGHLRLLLSGPKSSAGRPMPDGRVPEPGGWNRIHLIVDDLDGRGRATARGRADVPQRHRHAVPAGSRSSSRTRRAT